MASDFLAAVLMAAAEPTDGGPVTQPNPKHGPDMRKIQGFFDLDQ